MDSDLLTKILVASSTQTRVVLSRTIGAWMTVSDLIMATILMSG